MPENENPDEGKAQVSAGGEQPSTASASEKESQPLPEYVAAILNRLDAMEKIVKGVQKGTDKQIRNQVNGSIERILELAQSGKSKAEIERELWIDSMMQGRSATDAEAVSDKDSKADSGDTVRVIDEVLQLPANDSRVTDLKLKFGNDPKEYLSESLKLLARLGAQEEESTPAEQPLPSGKAIQKDENPIKDIDDPKALYRLAAQQIAKETKGRRVAR